MRAFMRMIGLMRSFCTVTEHLLSYKEKFKVLGPLTNCSERLLEFKKVLIQFHHQVYR